MRITNSTLLRNYDRNLKRISTAKYSSENKIYSGRQYTRASQSPLKAAKALTVRKQLWHTEQYKENLNVADKFYTEAETSLLQISDSLANVRETIIYACNSTKDESVDLNILAEQLETKAKEMVSIFNTDSAERAIFGGESNSAEPFTLQYDENGRATTVLYHGVPVNAMSDASGYPYSKDVYIDIGIGMVINDNQEIDPQSALKISFNGAAVSGCGFEGSDKDLSTLNLKSLNPGADDDNTIRITAGGKTVTVNFKGRNTADIQKAIDDAFNNAGVAGPKISEKGELTMADGSKAEISETPQSALKISFNGAAVSGCGFEGSDKDLSTLNLKSLNPGADDDNTIRITAGGKTVTVNFKGRNTADIQKAIDDAFNNAGVAGPKISEKGELTMADGSKAEISETPYIDLEKLTDGKKYSFDIYANGKKKTINFTAGATAADSMKNIQDKLNEEFKKEKNTPVIAADGSITVKNNAGEASQVYLAKSDGDAPTFKNGDTYSNNYIQVTLDAAAALRRGDLDYANACIDRIVNSSENLLVEIADLGNAEEYIEFNTSRFDTRELNLKDRQKTLEATDLESEITLMKTYEAIYNAALQMSSSIIPNSIFNYIS